MKEIDISIKELFPPKYVIRGSYIFDGEGKVCMNILYEDGEIIQTIIDKLNGSQQKTPENKFYLSDDMTKVMYVNREIFLMRGWGWLTGIDGLNYDADTAAFIQLEFLNYVIKTLNNEIND